MFLKYLKAIILFPLIIVTTSDSARIQLLPPCVDGKKGGQLESL
jgi:hypothetical protein